MVTTTTTNTVGDAPHTDLQHQLNTTPCKNVAPVSPFADRYDNLASASRGSKVLFATDDWFAVAENLLQDGPPIFVDGLYCEQGKVLDGWETRRRRQAGYDWCLIQLSSKATIHALELDTAHFTGNNTPNISLEICDLSASELTALVSKLPNSLERLLHGGVQGTGRLPTEVETAREAVSSIGVWKELLPTTPLLPGFEPTRMHYFPLTTPMVGNIVRVNYYPDGGVARFRVWGTSLGDVKPDTLPLYMPITTCDQCTVVSHSSTDQPPSQVPYEYPELSSMDWGGIGGACSNKHYGEPWQLTQSTLGKDMGDGWETARHPNRPSILVRQRNSTLIDSPLMDWAIIQLGQGATHGVVRVIIDTKHFKGNFPESAMVEGCYSIPSSSSSDEGNDTTNSITLVDDVSEWFTLIPRTRMSPDAEHVFERSKNQITNTDKPITHVRVSMFPDGGISRVRIYG
jgi:allantoicase